MKTPVESKSSQEQTVLDAHEGAYGLHCARQTGPFAPPSSMQSRPESQVPPVLHTSPEEPACVQVCVPESQPKPLVQSVDARHCTQACGTTPVLHTGVVEGQSPFPVQPVVCGWQTLALVHTWPLPQSVSCTHCTQELPLGLSLHTGVGWLQSCACVATVHTGTQVKLGHRYPAGHC